MSTVSAVIAAAKVKTVIVGVGNIRHINTPQSLGYSTMNMLQKKLKFDWEYKPVIGCKIATKGSRLFVQPQHFSPLPTAKAISSILKYHGLDKNSLTVIHDDDGIPSGRYAATKFINDELNNERVITMEVLLGPGFRKFGIGTKIPSEEGFSESFMDRFRGQNTIRKGKPFYTLDEYGPKMPFLPRQKELIVNMFKEEENDLLKRITDDDWVGDNLREGETMNRTSEVDQHEDDPVKVQYTLVYEKYNQDGEGEGEGELVPVDTGLEDEEVMTFDTPIEEQKLELSNERTINVLQKQIEATIEKVKNGKDVKGSVFQQMERERVYHHLTKEEVESELDDVESEDPEDSLEEGEIETKAPEKPAASSEETRKMMEYLMPYFLKDAVLEPREMDLSTKEGRDRQIEQMSKDIADLKEGKRLLEERFGAIFPESSEAFADDADLQEVASMGTMDIKEAMKSVQSLFEEVKGLRERSELFGTKEELKALRAKNEDHVEEEEEEEQEGEEEEEDAEEEEEQEEKEENLKSIYQRLNQQHQQRRK